MPYFFILPVLAAVVVLLGGFAIACRVAPSLRPLYPVAWRILLWSTIGAVVANGAVLLLYFVPVLAPDETAADRGAGGVLKILLAAGLLVGPIVASALGLLAGATVGVFLGLRSLRGQEGGRGSVRPP